MLGRKDYTREEFDHAKSAVKMQLAAYEMLAGVLASEPLAETAHSELGGFEGLSFNSMTLVLDRFFVPDYHVGARGVA